MKRQKSLPSIRGREDPLISLASKEACVRQKMVERIDHQFGRTWYHLFKFMVDIESRRIASCNPQAQEESRQLTRYAARTLESMVNGDPLLSGGTPQLPPSKREASELAKRNLTQNVGFSDRPGEKCLTKREDVSTQHENRYRHWVLESCGIPDTFGPAVKPRRKRTMGDVMNRVRIISRFLLPTKREAGSRSVPPRLKDDAGNRHGGGGDPLPEIEEKDESKKREESGEPAGLFEPGMFLTQTWAAGGGKRKVLVPSDELKLPYSTHAEHAGRLGTRQLEEVARTQRALREPMARYMKQLYGKHGADSPAARQRIVQSRSRELYQLLLEGQRKSQQIMLSNAQGRNTGLRPCKSLPEARRKRSSGMSIAVGREIRLFPTFDLRTGRQSPAPCFGEQCCTQRSRSKHESDLDAASTIVRTCTEAQDATERSLNSIASAQRTIRSGLASMKGRLAACDEAGNEARRQVRSLTDRKHLFIYGKNGLGRFITAKGQDMVRMGDLMMRMNPKYPFMRDRLSEILSHRAPAV